MLKKLIIIYILKYFRRNGFYKVLGWSFEIVKFADNMMFGNEGFPVTHCGAGITSLSIHPDVDKSVSLHKNTSSKKTVIFSWLLKKKNPKN